MVTFGVEEEFMLVDQFGQLSNDSAAVLADTPPADGQLQREMVRCQVESASPVCSRADELLDHLKAQRAQLAKAADRHGLRILPAGSAPQAHAGTPALTAGSRYERMAEHFGGLIDDANICGCHVHVSIPDPATGVQVSNHMRPWLPLLLALSANSPFAAGKDTGYASWRHRCMTRWPASGPPPYFESEEHYTATVGDLVRSGAITDERMIYWDIRLSPTYPTLEIRVCDVAPTAEDATLLAVLIRALATQALHHVADRRIAPRVSTEVLRASLWRAGRDGLEGHCLNPDSGHPVPVWSLVEDLVDQLDAVFRPGERAFVDDRLAWLRAVSGCAARQRAAFARRGQIADVIDLLC
ncbi:hypothetical protein ALI144C_01845 [Actinosynnema sp. ALI-1.44]|uniref:carboxylate-amine ligase n=1 Tax=Actinosynnema sp. ALI-1.44 TaxID=1933779 RepID=UPI00097CABCF|nr:glutamate--cysteine ligase [Actinosynnema sp. ALI-1.44]ONI90994.1 hypothetical protein ALI144C_01845 [Actinosynnema sp. ALI-1.44]